MKRLSFSEAAKVMVNMHEVFVQTRKECLTDLPHEAVVFILLSATDPDNRIRTTKDLKEMFISKHNITDKKELAHWDVKISKMFKTLTEQGIVELHPDQDDARMKKIVMTPKGEKMVHDFMELAEKKWNEVKNM